VRVHCGGERPRAYAAAQRIAPSKLRRLYSSAMALGVCVRQVWALPDAPFCLHEDHQYGITVMVLWRWETYAGAKRVALNTISAWPPDLLTGQSCSDMMM